MGQLRSRDPVIHLLEPTRPAGFVSGGYRYQELVAARLLAQGTGRLSAVAPAQLAAVAARSDAGTTLVVDGLFGELGEPAPPAGARVLLHTTPTHAPWWHGRDVLATAATTAAAVQAAARSVHVVRPGVDAVFSPVPAPPAGDGLRIVCIGTICPGKGQLLLVQSLRALGVRCEVTLLGDATTDPAYAAAVRAAAGDLVLRLRGVVAMTDVACELQRAHLLVSASRSESYGMAVAEAVACSVPVCAFATGEIATFVREGDNGVLVAPTAGDDTFRSRLVSLLLDPAMLATLRRHPPPEVRRWERVADEFAAACAPRR